LVVVLSSELVGGFIRSTERVPENAALVADTLGLLTLGFRLGSWAVVAAADVFDGVLLGTGGCAVEEPDDFCFSRLFVSMKTSGLSGMAGDVTGVSRAPNPDPALRPLVDLCDIVEECDSRREGGGGRSRR
jgi:hypothetical protein